MIWVKKNLHKFEDEKFVINYHTQNMPKYFEYSITEAFFRVDNFNIFFKYLANFLSWEMNLTTMFSPFSSHTKIEINENLKR